MMDDIKIQKVTLTYVIVNGITYHSESKVFKLAHSIYILYRKLKEEVS